MSNPTQDDLINELLQRIERLELHEVELQQEVEQLRAAAEETERLLLEQAVETTTVQAQTAGADTDGPVAQRAVDRDGTEINVGDAVFILTRGVYRQRWGTITQIILEKNKVHILDNDGITQTRKPRNVRLDRTNQQD